MAKKWNHSDDAKLAELFRTKKVDPTKTDKGSVLAVVKKYWPERADKFESFLSTYKRKCNKWNLEQTLKGARGGVQRECLFVWEIIGLLVLTTSLLAFSWCRTSSQEEIGNY